MLQQQYSMRVTATNNIYKSRQNAESTEHSGIVLFLVRYAECHHFLAVDQLAVRAGFFKLLHLQITIFSKVARAFISATGLVTSFLHFVHEDLASRWRMVPIERGILPRIEYGFLYQPG
jgi:hypothetical protein